MGVMRMALLVFAGAAAGLTASAPAIHAASFDCAAARSPLEKAICADPDLSRADEVMARVYHIQHAATPTEFQQRLRDSQRSWLAYIGPFCSVPATDRLTCLRAGFKERTTELSRTVREVGGLTFFRTSTYVVGLDPDWPDRAFTHKTDFLRIVRPTGPATDAWNHMAIMNLQEAAKTDGDVDDLETLARLSGASADLVSVRFGTSFYQGGMAHPQYQSNAVVWSLRLGRPLSLADLFKDAKAGKDRLAKRALAHFEGASPDSATLATIRETLDSDSVWEATPAGLLLDYDPYTFGCYVCTGRALVPWPELAPYLRDDMAAAIKALRD